MDSNNYFCLIMIYLQTVIWFQVVRLTSDIRHEKTLTRLRKGNLKRESESPLIAAQNNTMRTNHIKARIDKAQQNSRCRLCGDRDETVNHIISECRKLAQKEYKTWQDWVGKVIHWELCKELIFDHRTNGICTNQDLFWRMTRTKSSGILRQTDHLISARRPDNIINKKEITCRIVDFAVPADHRVKMKEREKKDKSIDLAKGLKNCGT